MKTILITLLLASQNLIINETRNIKYNEIEVTLNTQVKQSNDYSYIYSLENKGHTKVLISFWAINKIARPENILIELASKEKKDFTFTSRIVPVRFSSTIEIFVPGTQPRFLYDSDGTLNFPRGNYWMLIYRDVIQSYLPSNLSN